VQQLLHAALVRPALQGIDRGLPTPRDTPEIEQEICVRELVVAGSFAIERDVGWHHVAQDPARPIHWAAFQPLQRRR
jgi:hypothetical protein